MIFPGGAGAVAAHMKTNMSIQESSSPSDPRLNIICCIIRGLLLDMGYGNKKKISFLFRSGIV
jgi:hypothetical protein